MKIAGIVCEYNPFHKGHQYQTQKLRQLGYTHIVGIMSPNFVQRGDIAIFEKRKRATAALLSGLDLVIELPTPYAVSSAGQFAFGGVNILKNMGCIDAISFGGESDNKQNFFEIANLLIDKNVNNKIKEILTSGVSYQTAVTKAIGFENESFLKSPNNLLGTEYVKQMLLQNANFDVEVIKREGADHLETDIKDGFSSASAIRKQILDGNFELCKSSLTESGYNVFKDLKPAFIKELEQAILYKLRSLEKDDFSKYADVSEGLDNRFLKAIKEKVSTEEIIDFVKSKRYTHSRIRRIVINILIDIPKDLSKQNVPYVRILGCNKKGGEVIKVMKKTAILPVSHSLAKLSKLNDTCKLFATIEERATDIYSLCQTPIWGSGEEYKINSVIL